MTSADIDPILQRYADGRAKGSFDNGIEQGLRLILANPKFIFRTESAPAGAATQRVTDLELATRLSFFLWSSIPDDQLLDAAAQGTLSRPKVLEHQVRRMLADPRARALVDNFASQWLMLRNLKSHIPNPGDFPNFDNELRDAFRTETELFFQSIVREDRSVLDLLNADYTFVNERLARHYGIPNVYGSHFRRVRVQQEERRGLLGQGSILTVTSYPNRTSPVLRGKWILENVLGTPPPAPPPNVPALSDNEAGQEAAVACARAWRRTGARPSCASCHRVMDPLGFALENFDGIGEWRVKEPGGSVDPERSARRRNQGGRPGGAPPGAEQAPGDVRSHGHGKADDLRPGPRARLHGHAARARHLPRGRAEQLQVVGARPRHRQERAVPDEEGAGPGVSTN